MMEVFMLTMEDTFISMLNLKKLNLKMRMKRQRLTQTITFTEQERLRVHLRMQTLINFLEELKSLQDSQMIK